MTQPSLVRRLAQRRWWGTFFGYDRNVYLLLLFTLGKGFQLSIGAVTINLYALSLGFNLEFIGVLVAMSAVGALVSAVPMGVLADRIGRKPLVIFSALVTPFSLVAIGLSTSAPLLIATSLLNGIVASPYWVTNLPLLTESTSDEQRVGALALNNFLLLGVGALGGLIGGFVPEVVSGLMHVPATNPVPLRWGVCAAAFIVFLPGLPLFWIREQRGSPQKVDDPVAPALPAAAEAAALIPPSTEPAVIEPVGRFAITTLFLKLLVPDVLFTTGEGAVVGLLQVFFLLKFHLQVGSVGVLYTIAGLVGGATSLAAPRFVRHWGKLRMATTMQYLSAPAMLLIGFSPFLLLSGSAEFIRQILRGLFEPVYAAFAMERVSTRHRATLSGFYSVTWSVGYSVGPIVAGWLQQNVGLSSAFLIGGGCLLLSATLLRVFFPGE